MCEAIQTIADRAAEKAAKEAAEKAEQERIKMLADNVKKLMRKMNFTAEQSMDILEISNEDRSMIADFL